MSSPMTRGQLKTRALQRGDFQNSQYIDQSAGGELEGLVDTELRKLWNMQAELDPDRCMRGPFLISTQAYQRVYQLPTDFMNMHSIYYVVSTSLTNNQRVPLRRFNEMEYSQRVSRFSTGSPNVAYRVIADHQVQFDPPPTTSQPNIIEYYYIPTYATPSSDTQPLTAFLIPGWEDYVVDGVAANMRIKEGAEDATLLLQKQAAFEQAISTQIADRDHFRPARFNDTGWEESGWDGDYQSGFYGNNGSW